MGMSSSQARLLTLTARQHSIEFKAQRLQAEKLRLANESDRVYDAYLDALDAKKIQYRAIAADGTTTFKDATLNAMENGIIGNWTGETSNEILFVQNAENGKMYVTPAVAAKYGLTSTANETRDLDTFVTETTGKTKSTRDIIKQHEVEDQTKITGFNAIPNAETKQPVNDINHTYNPIENIEGGIDYSALAGYAEFNASHSASTASATEITGATTAISAGTYSISTAEGLKKFAELSATTDTTGVNIVISGNIDMNGVTGWSGIQNFAGTFDGNGYVISNLTGTNGLFESTNNATVKNVGLENVNINGNSAYVGGLIGYASQTNISNCYTTGSVSNINNTTDTPDYTATSGTQSAGTGGLVGGTFVDGKHITYDNIYSTANVTGINSVGGLLGSTWVDYRGTEFDLKNCYAIGSVKGNTNVGGLAGRMWYDQDNSSDITDIVNAYTGGSVNGSTNVGGFCGDFLYWGDNSDYCKIIQCQSTGKVNGNDTTTTGAFFGKLHIKNATSGDPSYIVNVEDSGYSSNAGPASGYGMVEDTTNPGTDIRNTYLTTTGGAGLIEINMAGSIPSIEADGSGDYMKNIIAALTKAGAYDPCEGADTAMENKIKNFLKSFNDDDTDNSKLWYLNNAINEYLKGTGSAGLGSALAQDIQNGTKTATATFQNGDALDGSVKRAPSTTNTVLTGTHNVQKGEVTIASKNNIAQQLYYAFRTENKTIDQTTVTNWINANYNTSNADDKVILANINNAIQNGNNLNGIYNAIINNQKYTDDTLYNKDEWNISFNADQTVTPSYGTKMEDYVDGQEEYWDTTDPDIANAIAMYALAQRGVEVVTEAQASSKVWISNMVAEGAAVLTTFDPSQVDKLANISEDELMDMTDAEYEDLMGIKNTSVSVNTAMREVADETDVKKAEAQYEADMKRIDRKDANYDRQLAVCENERNAIKLELDSLKTVINDNVDMNFKLFS
ncbi:MAG: hypothetical protein NC200_08580 [Candidatus Gastranaerophilales bacterium]|nr:hypothetical protein [Candidatus Gastranaerophilales bacterium]